MKAVRTALAAAAVTSAALAGALVAAPASAAPRTPAAPACGSAAPGAATAAPLIDVTISGSGMTVKGSRHLAAGAVRFRLHASGDERQLAIVRFRNGYTQEKFVGDLAASFADDKFHRAAWTRLLKGIVGHGGLDVHRGRSAEMTTILRPGTYYFFDDSGDLPRRFRKLEISPITCGSAAQLPATSATVTLTGRDRFGGDAVLPARGSILVRNTARSFEHLHFMELVHVKPGTTRADVLRSFKQHGPQEFALAARAGTDVLSPRKQQVFTYSLPPGTYMMLCFIPDLDGVPHAFEGMVRIVELR